MWLNILQEGYPEMIKPTEHTFTVVIFSSTCTKEPVEKKKFSVENITWPETIKQKKMIGNNIVKNIVDIYSEMLQKSCRIICIDAFGSEGKVSGEIANSVLKYLKLSMEKYKKRPPIDVIILPTFFLYSGNYAREIMESLWYLRKHAVLISNSSQHATLPNTEVIAVGGDTQQVKANGSILDFVVVSSKKPNEQAKEDERLLDNTDWHDTTLVQTLASVVVSAIALQIISCISESSINISGSMFHIIPDL